VKKIVLFIWQLPQELLGMFVAWLWTKRGKEVDTGDDAVFLGLGDRKVHIIAEESRRADPILRLISGCSLGSHICLTDVHNCTTWLHENGHCKQSQILGWLYLPLIGIFSAVFCNLWDRLFHKKWCSYDRVYWYYKTRWSEKWADKLGCAYRDYELQKYNRPKDARFPAV
jgi:hypothetical protein